MILMSMAVAGALVVALTTYGVTGYRNAVATARLSLEGRAGALSEYMGRTFEAVDLTLHGTAVAIEQDLRYVPRTTQQVHEELRRANARLPHVRALVIFNTDGYPSANSISIENLRFFVGDRPYFLVHKESVVTDLYIDTPVESRGTQEWLLVASRRLAKPDGSFHGIVTAAISPESFRDIFDSFRQKPKESLAIVHADSTLIAASLSADDDNSATGAPLSKVEPLSDVSDAYMPLALRGGGIIQGEKTLSIIRPIQDTPTFVLVTRTWEDVLGDWRDNLYVACLLTFGAMALFFVLIIVNIRSLKRTEAAERERDRLVRLSPDLICTCDLNGVLLNVNPAFENTVQKKRADVVGTSLLDFVHPNDRDKTIALFSRLARGELVTRFVNQWIVPGHHHHNLWIAWSGVARGSVIYGIGRDISDTRQAELQLREGESRLRAILDNVVDGIITIDSKGTIESFNAAAQDIFGYDASAIIGKNVRILMPEPHQSNHDAYIAHYKKSGQKQIIGKVRELEGLRSDGSLFPMELAISEIFTESGTIFTGVVRDITERKRVDRMKNEFIATVSHELRTPLTSIQGAISLVIGGTAGMIPQKAADLLDIAKKNGERLIGLVNDILDIQKIESGRVDYRLETFDVADLIDRTIEANKEYADQYGVGIVTASIVRDVTVFADFDRLLQVLTNLVSNAVKFSPKGDTITLSMEPGARHVRIAVKDHGRGIPQSFRARIFDKFAQADGTDSRQKGGSGLGLSIAKAIVESLGGTIGFESEEGQGSTFYVDMPRESGLTANATAHSADQTASRLLICGDASDTYDPLCRVLRNEGMNTDVVETSAQALALLEERTFDVFILDLNLKNGDPLSLVHTIREREETRTLPIIVLATENSDNREVFDAEALGIFDWINKPIEQDHLMQVLQGVRAATDKHLPHILHIEDDLDLVHIVGAIVEEHAEVTAATTLAEGRRQLSLATYDLVVIDVGLPDGNGLDLIEDIKRLDPAPPVLIFSAYEHGRRATDAISAALVKSRTTNEKLLKTIRDLIGVS